MTAAMQSTADRIGSTAFLAALGHGVVILGITFTTEPFSDTTALPTLNVTLLVDSREIERSQSDTLAQRDQKGGNAPSKERAASTLAAAQPLTQLGDPLGADLENGTPREPMRPAEQLISNRASNDLRATPQATEDASDIPKKQAALLNRPVEQNLVAEIDLEAAQPADDSGSAGLSTQASALAEYLVGWRQRVERIGTANFPQHFLQANRNLGRPTLEVAIGAQGQLEEIIVRRSSGDTTLDQAALKILRLAAPFEPLPASILAENNVLRFAYEWEFSVGADDLTAGLN